MTRVVRGLIGNVVLIGLLFIGVGLDVGGLRFPLNPW